MDKHFYKRSIFISALMLLSMLTSSVYAQWQRVQFFDAAYSGYVTKSGNLLVSDYQFYGDGGIFISEDGGHSWEKTLVMDYAYNKFYAYGDYIYALGYGAHIARSEDEGKTWKLCNYRETLDGIMDAEDMDATVAYGITEHKGKLYVADFSGGGVIYSEDYGDTWKRTDVESLKYSVDGGQSYTENIYQLVSFKDHLYAFGVFYVFEYNEAEDKWIPVRDDSNFMAVSTIHDGNLYCGRSCPNDDPDAAFLEMTSDFNEWTILRGPQELITRNVRVLASDDKYIYVATQDRGAFMYDTSTNKWYNLCDGYPELNPGDPAFKGQYMSPTQIFTDEENVYLIIYDFPGSQSMAAGLYKFPKEELERRTSITEVEISSSFYIDGDNIIFNEEDVRDVVIYDISGKQVIRNNGSTQVNISILKQGIYVIEAVTSTTKIRGKIII